MKGSLAWYEESEFVMTFGFQWKVQCDRKMGIVRDVKEDNNQEK